MNDPSLIPARAAVADGAGNFSIEDITLEAPRGREVMVEIHAAGVCHTDYDSLNWGSPILMGHEGAGVVTQVGDDVTKVNVGDRVMLSWAIPCGHCFQCSAGRPHLCEVSSPVTGTMHGSL